MPNASISWRTGSGHSAARSPRGTASLSSGGFVAAVGRTGAGRIGGVGAAAVLPSEADGGSVAALIFWEATGFVCGMAVLGSGVVL
jgi:hypothetical protein